MSVLPRKGTAAAVGQMALFGTVLPGDSGRTTTQKPLERSLVGQKDSKARPTSRRADALGTPAVPSRGTEKPKAPVTKRYTGREAGGAACIGCTAYLAKRNSSGGFSLRGWCGERDRDVHAGYRGACGLYEFHTRKERSAVP